MERRPHPFRADRPEERLAIQNLPVNTSLGEWQALGPSNFGGKVYAIAVDPSNPANVYVATEVAGLWGTHNGGQSWIPMFNGFKDIAFSSVKTHPSVPGLVAAGLIAYGGGYFTSLNQHVGVVLSLDGGNSWSNIGPAIDLTISVWEIAFGDATGQTIYAPTDKGLYKTTNQGQTWKKILNYSGTSFFDDRPSFAVDPANSSILLLAVQSLGVMRSSDAGDTWSRVDNWVNPGSKNPNATILTWSSANTNYVYAEAYTAKAGVLGTYLSSNAGQTWSAGATDSDPSQGMYDMAIAADPFDANHVVIHNTSLRFSTDGLKTLNPGNTPGPDCLAVAFDPSIKGVVYSGGDNGVFQSKDGGATWTRFDAGVLTNKAIGGSAYGVGTDGRIWINPADYYGVRFTPGMGWTVAPSGYEYTRYYVNPHDPTDVYNLGDKLTRVATPHSDEAQIDPAPGESNKDRALEFDPMDPNTIYLGKQNLYKSTNRGNSWSRLGVAGSSGAFQVVKVAPSNAKRIYAVASDTIWTTRNGGSSWAAGASVDSTNMIAVSPTDDTAIYIASDGGLYKSTDGGLTVMQLSSFPNVSAQWVTVDPNAPSTVYAALTNGGVLVSQNAGASWQQLGSQLPLVQPNWMTLAGSTLYLGTGASVWALNTGGGPICSQATATPSRLVVPSAAGSYPVEIFAAASCSWQVQSTVNWAQIATYGANAGHAMVSVSVTDNSAGAARSGTIDVAGISIPITQFGGPDPVQDGAVVTLRNRNGCLTLGSDQVTLNASACQSGNTAQQFSLKSGGAFGHAISNTGNCMDVYGNALKVGSQVGGYPCNYNSNEIFQFQPQNDGTWFVYEMDSGLCISTASSGSILDACSSANGGAKFTITPVGSGSNQRAPLISRVTNAASDNPLVAPNTWIAIYGSNLSPGTDTRIWQGSDFVNNQLPTRLDGVSVTVNGKPAYVYYISPVQLDVLTPPDAMTGPVQVRVTSSGQSASATAQAQSIAPSFFLFNGGPYVAATHANGSLLGPASLYPGLSTPARPGETIVLYANGFGPTSTPVVSGSISQSGTLSPLPVIKIGGVTATVAFAGLVSSGQFQFNVVVPPTLTGGDQEIVASHSGSSTQLSSLITVHR